jgi:peroxiredoxin
MLEAGAPAPDIQLATMEGGRFSLREQLLQGPVVLVFFKISCPTCQFTLPFLQRLYDSALPGSPELFGISQDKPDATREFNQHFGIRLPMLLDGMSLDSKLLDSKANNFAASNAFQITNVPSLFLIEPTGRIAWSLNGFHKLELEELGKHFGRSPFLKDERVPILRPG